MKRTPVHNPNLIWLPPLLAGQLLILIGLMLILRPAPVLANSTDMSTVIAHYPQLDGTRLDSCDLCHTSTRPCTLNGYGQDFKQNRTTAGLTAIEALDSDGDGFANIDEINALTFPGNAADHPAEENADMSLARQKYPAIVATRLDSCELCHTTGSALNPYGADYNANGRNLAAFAAIEAEDSDNDSYTNLAEINELTFPGSAADYPIDDTADLELALLAYPQLAGTRLDSCTLCHTTDYSLNSYGQDYSANGRNLAAFTAIETLDSDGDGFRNRDELDGLTFPGDVADYPDDLALAMEAYPHLQATDLASCTLCHTTDYNLNAYGRDYRDNGRNPAAFSLIEPLDSDGDGHPNLDELTLIYFPGDPVDYPAHMELLLLQYPYLDNTPLETCDLCHTDNWELNGYGADYLAAGNNRAAFTAIEALDSDGDGVTNINEIIALTLPGSAPAQQEPEFNVFVPVILK